MLDYKKDVPVLLKTTENVFIQISHVGKFEFLKNSKTGLFGISPLNINVKLFFSKTKYNLTKLQQADRDSDNK